MFPFLTTFILLVRVFLKVTFLITVKDVYRRTPPPPIPHSCQISNGGRPAAGCRAGAAHGGGWQQWRATSPLPPLHLVSRPVIPVSSVPVIKMLVHTAFTIFDMYSSFWLSDLLVTQGMNHKYSYKKTACSPFLEIFVVSDTRLLFLICICWKELTKL